MRIVYIHMGVSLETSTELITYLQEKISNSKLVVISDFQSKVLWGRISKSIFFPPFY